MNAAALDKLVQTVLYEGYILYPYRASSQKNRRRFTFGRVYPEDFSRAEGGREPCLMQTECLLQRLSSKTKLRVQVRFLHPMMREIAVLKEPVVNWPPTGETSQRVVPELRLDGKLYQTWQEAVEREVNAEIAVDDTPRDVAFSFADSEIREPIRNEKSEIAAMIVRRQQALSGIVKIATKRVSADVSKIRVQILNQTAVSQEWLEDQEEIGMRTFASTHTVLSTHEGRFLSQMDPPVDYREAAETCQNIGTYPVLVGDENQHEADALLSSPIILYDYPKIAPESAGDLFDGLEIDEILTLRVMAMTEAEKLEMRTVDEQARRILERTENLSTEHLLGMHGTLREAGTEEEFFKTGGRRTRAAIDGVPVKCGDRVRIRPKKRADVMDIALDGKVAIIEAVEEDFEKKVHLALVLDDDPGRDLGLQRQSGHRFFYTLDEVELVDL